MNQIKTKQWYQIVENNCKKEEVIKFVAVIGLIYGSLSAQCFQIFFHLYDSTVILLK